MVSVPLRQKELNMKPGDKVKLKTGGPSLVIIERVHDDEWRCVWWNANSHAFHNEVFKEIVLEAVRDH
jgi:uncharacterized protein YodC (DUF2158 family)